MGEAVNRVNPEIERKLYNIRGSRGKTNMNKIKEIKKHSERALKLARNRNLMDQTLYKPRHNGRVNNLASRYSRHKHHASEVREKAKSRITEINRHQEKNAEDYKEKDKKNNPLEINILLWISIWKQEMRDI